MKISDDEWEALIEAGADKYGYWTDGLRPAIESLIDAREEKFRELWREFPSHMQSLEGFRSDVFLWVRKFRSLIGKK